MDGAASTEAIAGFYARSLDILGSLRARATAEGQGGERHSPRFSITRTAELLPPFVKPKRMVDCRTLNGL
jgi:hypothetical protein